MKTMILSAASRIATFFQSIRLQHAFVALLASVLLLTTACQPNSPTEIGEGSYNQRVGQPQGMREYTDRGDASRRPTLKSYNDNDARQTDAVDARAKKLSDQAERNIQKVQNPGDFAESFQKGKPLDQRTRDLADDIGGAANQFKDDFAAGAKENFRNLQSNTDKAKQNVQQAADNVQQDAARTGRDLSKNVQRGTEDVADSVNDRTRDAARGRV